MRPQPLPERIVGALRLAPMTLAQLARALGVSCSTARHATDNLRDEGLIRPAGAIKTNRTGRPHMRLAA